MQSRSRLAGNKRFSQLHKQGRSIANQYLVIRVLANKLDRSRFGFLVSKKIGNAIVRNRVRRRLREAVRSAPVEAGWDAVFIVRAGSVGANYHQMKLAVNNLLGRANLIANNYDSLPTGSDIH